MAAAMKQQGLSLVELLVAMGISLLLLSGLVTVFATSSQNQRELQKSAQQIENGRYAIQLLTEDAQHAGYWGTYSAAPTTARSSRRRRRPAGRRASAPRPSAPAGRAPACRGRSSTASPGYRCP